MNIVYRDTRYEYVVYLSPFLTQTFQQLNQTQLRMAIGFIGTEGNVCPNAGCSVEGLGVEFPHVGLVSIRDIVFFFRISHQENEYSS